MHHFLPELGGRFCSGSVRYCMWAPAARMLELEVVTREGGILRTLPMARDDRGFFLGHDQQGRPGDLYRYRLDGGHSFPDPASHWQPLGVHGPSMVIDPRQFKWNDAHWTCPPVRDLVIYETHVGTFTNDGTFRAAIEKLTHVRDLGANAIELMPIGDFPGERNWGYDGTYLYAPARCYGHPDDLRSFVDAAHRLGLAVILDVVYNHFGPDGNYLGAYIGPYLDENAKTPWGGAIRYGSPEMLPLREFVAANPPYWMREFHIDGFRLDATHEIVDGSPRHILTEITHRIHERGGFAIAEDSRNDARVLMPETMGGLGFDAVWADDFHHTVRVANTQENESYLGDFTGTLDELVDTLKHGWHFRGQTRSTRGTRGTECDHARPQAFVHCISNHDQVGNRAFGDRLSHSISPESLRACAALLCLTPYTPMLFMGEEWAASTPFQFFTDHEPLIGELVTAGRRSEFRGFRAFRDPTILKQIPDPQAEHTFHASKLAWDDLKKPEHAGMLCLYRECLSLRKTHPEFRPASRNGFDIEALEGGIGMLHINGEASQWLALFDLTGQSKEVQLQHPLFNSAGSGWDLVFSSNERRFSGNGCRGIDVGLRAANFTCAEFLLLRAPAAEGRPTADLPCR